MFALVASSIATYLKMAAAIALVCKLGAIGVEDLMKAQRTNHRMVVLPTGELMELWLTAEENGLLTHFETSVLKIGAAQYLAGESAKAFEITIPDVYATYWSQFGMGKLVSAFKKWEKKMQKAASAA